MSVFIFDNYQEFGLFFKINSIDLLELSSNEEFHGKVNEYVQIFDHTKGGCGCSLNKRRAAASSKYELFVPEFFTSPTVMVGNVGEGSPLGEMVTNMIKDKLGNPTVIHFKKDATDVDPFFLI